jgi:hypothetical protein
MAAQAPIDMQMAAIRHPLRARQHYTELSVFYVVTLKGDCLRSRAAICLHTDCSATNCVYLGCLDIAQIDGNRSNNVRMQLCQRRDRSLDGVTATTRSRLQCTCTTALV